MKLQVAHQEMKLRSFTHRSGELETTRHWERAFGPTTCIAQAEHPRVCPASTAHCEEVCLCALFLHFFAVTPHTYTSHLDHLPPLSPMLQPTLRFRPAFLICLTLEQGHTLIYLPPNILDDQMAWLCPGADLSCGSPHVEGASHPQGMGTTTWETPFQ